MYSDAETTFKVYHSTSKTIAFGVVLFALGVTSAGLLFPGTPLYQCNHYIHGKLAFATYLFLGLSLLGVPLMLKRLIQRAKPAIVVNLNGFSADGSTKGLVEWRHVREIRLLGSYGTKLISVELTEEGWKRVPLTLIARIGRPFGRLSGMGLTVASNNIRGSVEKLYLVMAMAYSIAQSGPQPVRTPQAPRNPEFYPRQRAQSPYQPASKAAAFGRR